MIAFLLRRLGQSLLLLLIVSVIGFAILHLAPGGPMSQFAAGGDMTQADLDRIAEQLGLNRPLPVQYIEWLWRMLRGDWGVSYRDQQPVLHIIASHIGATLELMLTSTLLAMVIGAWVGILGAIRRYSLFDSLATVGAMIALSIPTFWFGLVVIYVFSVGLGWLPSGNRYTMGDGSFLNQVHHLIGPCIVLALVSTAVWSRYMRSSMLEVVNQDYIRTARAKGVPERQILLRHALRNALLPMITITGLHVPTLLSGALVTETVFTWPGMGRLFLDSISYRDYPVVMGILMFTAVLVLMGSLLADLLYGVADPRISRSGR
ncbi:MULTISPECIES: ABC transporter permease [unclassified Bosea (in: a-proteobacteria)]|uniref:ABC transporter permease n=1 Tax=unclassified Bosea (in: a-proteobacteria) TaxID=2653178 RepID=UPI000F76537E|nr:MULTISPECIES: ABC transporter permease [unclassified Bosea (in: a-proteobacteria)]AZO79105.1 diguanylate cyclase [Bosea sp. Tri-49]RXT27499.1 diguanylate cyclase [Bosea sp. Tri-39]RXT35796.1 diguanylate cyclase [Bosea sp. Tri-54]